ncbi:MAG: TRAP transporter small permease [Sphaerochaetaceae bacterium]|jgi:C4-dicarboxylate transporter DctQ subunit
MQEKQKKRTFHEWAQAKNMVPDYEHNQGHMFAEWLRVINHWAHFIMLIIAEVALASMIVIVFMTVLLRYVFNTGIGWAEEVPRLLVTLFAFLAMAFGVRDHIHISVNILYAACGPKGKKFFDYLADASMLLCGIYFLYFGGKRVLTMMKFPGTLPMTGWPTWLQYVPIPLAGFLITFDCILFMTGVLDKGDLLYSEKEVDYVAIVKQREAARHQKEASK